MLAARSWLDSEGRRLRASVGAGVSSRLSISERWNLEEPRLRKMMATIQYLTLANNVSTHLLTNFVLIAVEF